MRIYLIPWNTAVLQYENLFMILKDPTGVSGFGDMECPKPNPWILSLFIPIFVLFSMKIVLKM